MLRRSIVFLSVLAVLIAPAVPAAAETGNADARAVARIEAGLAQLSIKTPVTARELLDRQRKSAAEGHPAPPPLTGAKMLSPEQEWVGPYYVHSGIWNKCLDADTNTIGGNGTKVQVWDCNYQYQQRWWLWAVDGHGQYYIGAPVGGRVLDAHLSTAPANTTKVQLWDFNGHWNQNWSLVTNGGVALTGTNAWLDAHAGGGGLPSFPANGARAQLYQWVGNANQKWSFA